MFNSNFMFALVLTLGFSCGNQKNITENKSSKSDFKVDVFVKDLEIPWSIVFTDSNRILITERPGRLRLIENGKLVNEPVHTFDEISSKGEEGLMGLTLDPEYKNNKLIYLSYAYKTNGDMHVRVKQYKDDGKSISNGKIIIDNLPAAQYHCGCRLKFGPDKKLYITTGDAGNREYAQDLDKLYGKILRINSDGTFPQDNPFPNSPIWCYGNRNSQGIDWYPGTDIMWETEHGPSGFDGPGGGDEVNIIQKGKNYGWPIVHHRDHKDGMEDPLLEFTPAVAPASGNFYRSDVIPEFKNNFFFGCLIGNGIMRVIVDPNDKTKAASFEKICTTYGRIRDVVEGPDGAIYFSTSNLDGRGKPLEGDDKIYRLTAK